MRKNSIDTLRHILVFGLVLASLTAEKAFAVTDKATYKAEERKPVVQSTAVATIGGIDHSPFQKAKHRDDSGRKPHWTY